MIVSGVAVRCPVSRSHSIFEFPCPQCRRPQRLHVSQAGTRVTCSDCLEEFPVPVSSVYQPPATAAGGNKTPPADLERTESRGAESRGPRSEEWEQDRQQVRAALGKASVPPSRKPDSESPATPRPTTPQPERQPDPASEPYDFAMACPLCGTRQDLRSEQIGMPVQCPDCHTKYRVREPNLRFRRPRTQASDPVSDDFQLADVAPTDVKNAVMRDLLREAARQPEVTTSPDGPPPPMAAPDVIAREMLDQARDATTPEIPLPSRPMIDRVFVFLWRPIYLLRLAGMAFGIWLEWGAIESAAHLADAGPLHQFGSVILRPLALVLGLLMAANFATVMLAILHETAAGKDEIEGLPGLQPVEWFFESWPVTASFFLVMVLPALAAQGVHSVHGATWTAFLCLAGPGVCLFPTVFPILLLSFLENSTPISPAVLRGIRLAGRQTAIFIVQAAALTAICWSMIAGRIVSNSSFLNYLAAFGLVVAASLYFRVLGRLTWVCQERMAEAAEAAENATSP